jgi:hypothetical protein
MCHVLCHDCQTTVRRYLGLDNPTSSDVTKPMNVYFGKRGVAAPALGVGALTLQGVHGLMLLQEEYASGRLRAGVAVPFHNTCKTD